MMIIDSLTTEATRSLVHIRRALQGEIGKSFKLSQNEDVLKMLEYANTSENDSVLASLDVILTQLPDGKRSALSERGITGTLPEAVSDNVDSVELKRAADKKSGRRFGFRRDRKAG